ncbi:hypothetical protein Fot_32578 [Forsythia ovata]|uniref:Uncharacterized protein n=1 Tax=Forsythia ovata TaxID=205694 RepID=A0ABD1T8F7_9LAMI
MVKSKGQSVNIELEIGINSKKSKRKSSISGNRTKRSKNSVQEDFEELENVRNASIEFNPHSSDPPQSNPTGAFDGSSNSRGFTGDGENKQACCNLNEVVMNRIAKIESKQSEIEAKQAEILSFQQDLKSQLNDLSGNVQNMIADFLNQMDKKFHFDTEDVVLNRQIVLYSPILETQDEFEKNDFNNYTEFETEMDKKFHFDTEEVVLNRQIVLYSPILETRDEFEKNDFNNYTEFETEVQVEDNDGSQLKDFEVQSQVQNDRKGKGKSVFCDKTENESVHHGATEFEKIEQDDDIIQIDDITPSAPRRRTRKTAAVYRSPYISEFVSSGKSKAVIREIRSCTSALRDEINAIDVNDIVDFEEWFNMGLCKNNKKKKFNDNNKMISPPFSFGILEVVDKKWFYDLRTPEECLTDTRFEYLRKAEINNSFQNPKSKMQQQQHNIIKCIALVPLETYRAGS